MKGILEELEGRWDDLAEALRKLAQEARQGRQRDDSTGLDPETQAFLDSLLGESVRDAAGEAEARARLRELVVELVDHIRQEIALVGFWQRAHAREGLRSWIFQTLDDADVLPFGRLDAMADKLMELAKANHQRLVR